METREHDETTARDEGDELAPREPRRRLDDAFAREAFGDDDDDWQEKPSVSTNEDSFVRGAALDGLKLRVQSRQFRGGRITAVMSGVMLDMREAALSPEGATLDVQSALSGIDILVPADWHVVCDVDAVWSGVDGHRVPDRPVGHGPRLTVKGMVVAGGLRVR